ncbi:LAMI_0D12376g1_1 [Lachancea mirantina]|uniref:peptidyl-tRNA hydrolase n=1 Tax=Lachancea mirantina TaxID=1230905 RepID=A0A1G4JFU3_9SACH|nr:LAMI_0D12376g1_1 [Lachancea mirantina]
MVNLSSNGLATLFGVAAVSLATGYYLGQICPSVRTKKERLQDILWKCKMEAEREILNSGNESEDGYEDDEEEDDFEVNSLALNDIPGEVRMALVIRQDLGMKKGKIAAQCCHAALACYRLIASDALRTSYNPELCDRWLHHGQAKIALKCPDKEAMDELFAKSISLGVNSYVVHDAGRTQIAAGSATVLGLGPAPKAVLDQITGDLKLY